MPMTVMPYSLMQALVTARMAALRPGQSPPEVKMPIQRVLDSLGISVLHLNFRIIVAFTCYSIASGSANYKLFWPFIRILSGIKDKSSLLLQFPSKLVYYDLNEFMFYQKKDGLAS
jgi:hypothetical protein